MKLFSYLLVACAGLGLFACNTEDDPTIENGDGAKKSVALKLAGISGSETKATDVATDASASDHTIGLKDLKIVFYKNSGDGPIYRIETLNTGTTGWTELTQGAGYIFHDLDTNVDAVLVVGNYDMNKNFPWTTSGIDVKDIKDAYLLAAEENQRATPSEDTKSYVTLWDEGNLVPGGSHTGHTGTIDMYTATLTIKPLVARFEIGNIQCTDLGNIYDHFTLKGIGLIDMSLEASINGYLSPRLVIGTNIVEPGHAESGKYEFGNALDLAWAYDAITPNVIISSSGTKYNPDGTTVAPDGTKKFVYNFFPDVDDEVDATIDGFPNIKLVLDDVMLKTGPESSFDYVVTARFVNPTDVAETTVYPEAGKIYQINLAFEEKNIGPWNPDDFKCVIVDVNVAEWVIVPLKPIFK